MEEELKKTIHIPPQLFQDFLKLTFALFEKKPSLKKLLNLSILLSLFMKSVGGVRT